MRDARWWRSGGEEDFWAVPGEVQEAESGARGPAFALFPTASGGERDVEQGSEDRLADVEFFANGGDFLWLDALDQRRLNDRAFSRIGSQFVLKPAHRHQPDRAGAE